jgi:tetratricopeptide (TPR) repeat protein
MLKFKKYLQTRDPGDLEDAIGRQNEAVELMPKSHVQRSHQLARLSDMYWYKFQGNKTEEAILETSIQKLTLALQAGNLSDFAARLRDLGNRLEDLFDVTGNTEYLEESIVKGEEAVQAVHNRSTEWGLSTASLAKKLAKKSEHKQRLDYLEEAINKTNEATAVIPDDHPPKSKCWGRLGLMLERRLEQSLNPTASDWDHAISAAEQAVRMGYPDRANMLNHIGNLYVARLKASKEAKALETAVQ